MLKPTNAQSVEDYINQIDEPRKSDIVALHTFIKEIVPQYNPFLISGMIGYGSFHYKYPSGREGDWCVIALASQKQYISVYVCAVDNGTYIPEKYKDDLPKASIGKSCIRFKKVSDIDPTVLKRIILEGVKSQPAI